MISFSKRVGTISWTPDQCTRNRNEDDWSETTGKFGLDFDLSMDLGLRIYFARLQVRRF